LKIVVFVKQVPDTAAQVVVENGQVSWGDAELVINPWDEFAVEAALQLKENFGGNEVIAVSMGPESAKEALKTALAMGCNSAMLVSDPALENLDTLGAAQVLAAVVKHIGDVDVAVFGRQAVDDDSGTTGAMVARLLGWPMFTLVGAVEGVEGGQIRVSRVVEEGRQVVEAQLPAVLSIAKDFGEPRYPSFMGIRKAARAKIPTITLADLGVEAPQPVVSYVEVANPPKREVVCEFIEGDSPQEIAEKLADKLIAEKVL